MLGSWIRMLTLSVLLLWTAPCFGQSNVAMAEALFREGKELLDGERYQEACPKLEESHRLDPAVGTVLALAVCYEGAGKLASAWARYVEAKAAARDRGQQDREAYAAERAQALEPQLPRLTLTVPEAVRVPGLEIRLDGVALTEAAYDSAIPVDPGERVIEARAPGKRDWVKRVTLSGPGAKAAEVVGPLADREAPAAAPSPAAATAPAATPVSAPAASSEPAPLDAGAGEGAGNTQRVLGWVALGVGALGVGTGTAFYFMARSENEKAKDLCTDGNGTECASDEEYRQHGAHVDQAEKHLTNARIGLGVGAAALVAGAVLLLTAPSQAQAVAHARVQPLLGPDVVGMSWEGNW